MCTDRTDQSFEESYVDRGKYRARAYNIINPENLTHSECIDMIGHFQIVVEKQFWLVYQLIEDQENGWPTLGKIFDCVEYMEDRVSDTFKKFARPDTIYPECK